MPSVSVIVSTSRISFRMEGVITKPVIIFLVSKWLYSVSSRYDHWKLSSWLWVLLALCCFTYMEGYTLEQITLICQNKKIFPDTLLDFRYIFKFLIHSSSGSGWCSKGSSGTSLSQFKYTTSTSSSSAAPRKSGTSGGPGLMPVPQPKRSFLSTGGQYFG